MQDRIEGRVFDIQRFSIHDGPGIRTTVFLKGCPLRCVWCHNPEGIDPSPRLAFQPEKCIGCGYCIQACPNRAHLLVNGSHTLDRNLCDACGACTEECWAQALELAGRDLDVRAVMAEVMRDEPFHTSSGGGLTLSGGEPMMQIQFAKSLLEAAGHENVHRCLETSGEAPMSAFEAVTPHVDLFLFDIKDTDDSYHIQYTGSSNTRILANLKYLHDNGAKVRLRLPIIPGFNDRPDHFSGLASLVRMLPNLCGVEIMPYHKLGLDKDKRFGLSRTVSLPNASTRKSTLDAWIDSLAAVGVNVINPPHTAPY